MGIEKEIRKYHDFVGKVNNSPQITDDYEKQFRGMVDLLLSIGEDKTALSEEDTERVENILRFVYRRCETDESRYKLILYNLRRRHEQEMQVPGTDARRLVLDSFARDYKELNGQRKPIRRHVGDYSREIFQEITVLLSYLRGDIEALPPKPKEPEQKEPKLEKK